MVHNHRKDDYGNTNMNRREVTALLSSPFSRKKTIVLDAYRNLKITTRQYQLRHRIAKSRIKELNQYGNNKA